MRANSSESKALSLIHIIDRNLFNIERASVILSGVMIFALMVLAVWSVLGRQLFGAPLRGYVDWIELLMPLIAFMGLSYVQREGEHIRLDIIVGELKRRPLWAIELIDTTLSLILIMALIYGSWTHFERSFDWSASMWSRDSSIDIGLPIWPAKLVVPFAFSILAARLGVQIIGYIMAFVKRPAVPKFVPSGQVGNDHGVQDNVESQRDIEQ